MKTQDKPYRTGGATGLMDQNEQFICLGDVIEISELHDALSMSYIVSWKGLVIWEKGSFWLERVDGWKVLLGEYAGLPEYVKWFVIMEKQDATN